MCVAAYIMRAGDRAVAVRLHKTDMGDRAASAAASRETCYLRCSMGDGAKLGAGRGGGGRDVGS